MANAQERIQTLLDDLVERDVESGLQVTAYHRGKVVVDAWAGVADAQTGRLVDGETLFCVFSCTKAIAATAIHILVDRGTLEYDAPIARYWPEFARNGKAAVTLRQAMTHTSGIPQMPDEIAPADIGDWEKTCRAIANLTPLVEPGTQPCYHAISFGFILGEAARRADGRPFDQIVREEIAQPLGIDSLYLAIPDAVESRVATLEPEPWPDNPPDSLLWRAIPRSYRPLGTWANQSAARRAVVPAAGGFMNARSLARHYAALIGSSAGPPLLSAERMRIATALQTEDDDLILGPGSRKALGYGLGGTDLSSMGSRITAFGHGGAGASVGFGDPEHDFAFALTKTRLLAADPGEAAAFLVAEETRRALGIPA